MPHDRAGFSYLEVLVAVAIVLVVATSSSMAFTSGTRLSSTMRGRIELLNVGQEEMERLQDLPFNLLESYPIDLPPVRGQVTVDSVTPRRKRITMLLQHTQDDRQTLTLVTYIHRQGLHQ